MIKSIYSERIANCKTEKELVALVKQIEKDWLEDIKRRSYK